MSVPPPPSAAPPRLVAHRGYARRFPENTLLALREAVAAGARYLEFDVQLSADRVPVLLHDADLARTGGAPGRVFDLSAAALRQRAVGEPTRFGDRFRDEAVPALAEVAAWLATVPRVIAFVEVKGESLRHFGIEVVHAAIWKALEPARAQSVLIACDDAFLFAARLAAPVRIGWIVAAWDAEHERRARALAPDYLIINRTRLPSTALWTGPWEWMAYEADDADQAVALGRRGIGFVETMAIGELLGDSRLAGNELA
jgi:glycerophosphoryl diester phosphodiesterase